MRCWLEDVGQYVDQKVELKGWAYNTRSSGKIKFLQLRDGTGTIQCIFFRGECSEQAFEKINVLSIEDAYGLCVNQAFYALSYEHRWLRSLHGVKLGAKR